MCYRSTKQIAGDLAQENNSLKAKLESALKQYDKVVAQNRDLQKELQPFRNIYFKSLTTHVIAELAKSNLKTTTQLINAETLIDYILDTVTNASDVNAKRIIEKAIIDYRNLNNKKGVKNV